MEGKCTSNQLRRRSIFTCNQNKTNHPPLDLRKVHSNTLVAAKDQVQKKEKKNSRILKKNDSHRYFLLSFSSETQLEDKGLI